YYINNENRLTAKTGLVFNYGADDYLSVNNDKTLLGAKLVVDDKFDGDMEFFDVNVDGYSINKTVKIPAKEVYKDAENKHGWRHTGLAVSGNRAYQTVFPYANGVSPNLDTNYVAVYSYPEFELETVIKDTRTGPAGAPGNITGAMDSTQKEIIKKVVFYVSKQVRPSLIKAIILQPKTNQMAVSLLKQPTSVIINYSPRSIQPNKMASGIKPT